MMMNSDVVMWCVKTLVLLCVNIVLVEGISIENGFRVPNSPCPSVFQYNYDGEEWYGIISAPSLPYGTPVRLVARLSINRVLPSKYAGNLELLGSRSEILNALLNEQQIQYRVNFPLLYPIPVVTEISLNNRAICSGAPVAGLIMTAITLEHNLYPHGRNLDTNVQLPVRMQDMTLTKSTTSPFVAEATTFPRRTTTSINTDPNGDIETTETNLNAFGADAVQNEVEKIISLEVCGTPVIRRPLIANGEPVKQGNYPWLAAIFSQKPLGIEFTCGANLVSVKHVLTAAHCIKYGANRAVPADELLIILGKYKIHKWTERGTVVREAAQVVLHPDYKALNSDADLAVIVLADSVRFSDTIRPICMWTTRSDLSEFVGKSGMIVGWGRDETGQKITPEPKQTRVKIVSQEDCLRSRLEFRYITSNRTFCAGGQEPGSGPCSGDSGGGLLVENDGKWFLRGIISMSLADPKSKSCDLDHYSVFVDMAKFVDWVSLFLH